MQLNNALFTVKLTIYNKNLDFKYQTSECCEKVCRGCSSHVPERSSLDEGCLEAEVEESELNKNKKWHHKLFHTQTPVCIFSILFFIHFPRCWQGEFVYQSKDSLVGDNSLYIYYIYMCVIQGWYYKKKLEAYRFNLQQSHEQIPTNMAIYMIKIYKCENVSISCKKGQLNENNSLNPLTPISDKDRISPYSIYTTSGRQVMRIKENINYGITNWSDTRFSKLL